MTTPTGRGLWGGIKTNGKGLSGEWGFRSADDESRQFKIRNPKSKLLVERGEEEMELVISSLIRQNVGKFPEKVAFVDGDVRMNYRELNDRANRVANAVSSLGLEKGDRCGIMLYNRYQWYEIYFGLSKLGIIAVPINFRFTALEVEYVINNSQMKAIIYEEAFEKIISATRNKTPSVVSRICVIPGTEDCDYERLLLENSSSEASESVNETDPFCIIYTSGTTGFPKGTVKTHRNFVFNIMLAAIELGGLNKSDTMLVVMPIFHGNSTWFSILMLILGGTCVVYHSGGFSGEEVLQLIEKERITWTSLVPTMLTMILNLPEETRAKYDLSSMRVLLASSAPLMTKTKEQTVEFFKGIDIYEAYGATETGWVTILGPADQLTKVRSIGLPIFGKEVRVLDENGNDVKTGEVGEIFARGIGVPIREYWQNPEGTSKAFPFGEGWCTVGDMVRVDEEGYIYLEDRKSDMIISGGENVYPAEVENVVASHPKVQEVGVIAVPDELWGERVHAVIKLNEGETASAEEIMDFCRDKIAGYKRPRSVDFTDEFPKSPTGKILRRVLREKYWGEDKLYHT